MEHARILIVEDENIIALDLKSRLIGLGYAVPACVASGEEAIAAAGELRPDLVLMDIVLKGKVDGVQAAEHIRDCFNIPVIYLTAYFDEKTLQRARITEPYGYLLKPFEDRELYTTIEMAVYKHRIEQRLKENERWLATTLRSIGDAVIATDGAARVRFMNPVAEVLTGWCQEEALGRALADVFCIIDDQTHAPAENPLTTALEKGIVASLADHTVLIARDGREIPIDDSAAPIQDDKGHVTGVVLVFRDVTERKRAEEALRRSHAELQVRNEELDAFAHTVAHDLRHSLSLIANYAEVLNSTEIPMTEAERADCLANIAAAAHKMGNVIAEVLLLAEVRKADVELTSLDMAAIVAEAQQRLAHMVKAHQAEIATPAIWPTALGYSPWIEEVWVNYLSNAIQYGGRPPRLELGADPQAGGTVRFWVRDNGPGIAPADQARLFTPFTRLNQVQTQGHGLGLSIVRRIMEKLGGQVEVESQVGRGSVFSFTLATPTD